MNRVYKRLIMVVLSAVIVNGYASPSKDWQQAYEEGRELRPLVDGYLRSGNFSTDKFLAEILNLEELAPVVVVYAVEFNVKFAKALVGPLLGHDKDVVISSALTAALDRSPAMCPIIIATANRSEPAAVESIIAISEEAPDQVPEAVDCAAKERANIAAKIAQEIERAEVELPDGGTQPPISPN